MAGEASASTRDNQGLSAVEPAEDMLTDSLDGDRSSGEMLMECVVKVPVYPVDFPEMSSMQHGVAALGHLLNQLVDKCIAEADSILHFCPKLCQGSPSLHSQHQTAHCCAVHPHVCNNHSKCAKKQSCSADFLYTLRAQLFVTVAAQEAVQQHFKRIHHRWHAHSDQCPLRRSSHTGTSLLSAFMLFSRHSFISAFSLQACCNVQLLQCIQPAGLFQGIACSMHSAFMLVSRHSTCTC